jgi:hypothetical protein
MQHFAEIIVGGEGVEGLTTRDGNYFKILNPEMFRATFGPQIWGMKTIFINMVAREMPPERKLRFSLSNTNDRRDILHSYGYCVVHDVDMHAGLPEANKTLWSAQDKIGWNENVKFFPYWETDAVKLVSPMSNRILASAYSNGGKMLLAILNDTDKEENIKLCLDLKKLEVKSGLKGSDTWSPEKNYTLSGTFEDKIPAREFRMIVFDREK